MPFSSTLTPTPAAGKAIPYTWFTTLLDNTNWVNADKTWSSWSPTWTNGTLGNGTLSGKYVQFGKLVVARISLVWGSTTSSSGGWQFSLPLTAITGGSFTMGIGEAIDAGTGSYTVRIRLNTSTTVIVLTGEGGAAANIATTSPFTWTTSDELHLLLAYEAS